MIRSSRPTRLIALINQKGGVGKTTSTVNLGAALALAGCRTLLIDLDPQAHLTLHLGIDSQKLKHTVYDLMTNDQVQVKDVVRSVNRKLWVLPAHVNLAGVETELAPKMVTGAAQRVLKEKVEAALGLRDLDAGQASRGSTVSKSGRGTAKPRDLDFVLIDCPPSLGLLTINALALTRQIIVPMQAQFLALRGLSQLLETVQLVKQSFNPDLTVSGILLCMHENQTLLAQEVMADLNQFLEAAREQDLPWGDARVLEPPVRRNIKLAECPSFGKTIFDYEPNCRGAQDYRDLAAALIDTCTPHTVTETVAGNELAIRAAPSPEIKVVAGSLGRSVPQQASGG